MTKKRKLKQKQIKTEKPFEFKYRYRESDHNRDTTSDNWITFGKTKGLTYGEMSPMEICESQIKHCLKGIESELVFPLSSPDSVLETIAGQFNMLKNWQYILYCVRFTLENEKAE